MQRSENVFVFFNGESHDWLVYEETSRTMFCLVYHQHTSDVSKTTNSLIIDRDVRIFFIKLNILLLEYFRYCLIFFNIQFHTAGQKKGSGW